MYLLQKGCAKNLKLKIRAQSDQKWKNHQISWSWGLVIRKKITSKDVTWPQAEVAGITGIGKMATIGNIAGVGNIAIARW